MRAPVFVLEGAWDNPHEAPQILPYFTAYAQSHRYIDLQHRTFRCVEDIEYYVKKVPKQERAFFYFACHGNEGNLIPSDGRSKISIQAVENALSNAKEGSIEFVHFSCCDFVKSTNRRQTLSKLREAVDASWVSGYTRGVDWLSSTLLDLAFIDNVYVPWHRSDKPAVEDFITNFTNDYEQLARSLGLSGMYVHRREESLFPKRLASEV